MKQWRKSAEEINRQEKGHGRGRKYRTGPTQKYPFVSDLLRALLNRV